MDEVLKIRNRLKRYLPVVTTAYNNNDEIIKCNHEIGFCNGYCLLEKSKGVN